MRDHGLLNEKYRPTSLESFIGDGNLKNQMQSFIDGKKDLPNMTFHGPSGCGKTTLAKILIKNIDCDYLMINASDERGIDTIREKVISFSSSASFKPIKIVILDEADYLTVNAQTSLRNVIEMFSKNTRFILTCNFLERIIDPLQSRCSPIKILPPSKSDMANHLVKILDKEKITFEDDDLKMLFDKFYPDFRKILNTVQLNVKNSPYYEGDILDLDRSTLSSSKYITQVITELSKPNPSFKEIRQIIANSGQSSYEELFRALYAKASSIDKNNMGLIIIEINQHQYQAQFSIDKEINIMSLISKIIQIKTQ